MKKYPRLLPILRGALLLLCVAVMIGEGPPAAADPLPAVLPVAPAPTSRSAAGGNLLELPPSPLGPIPAPAPAASPPITQPASPPVPPVHPVIPAAPIPAPPPSAPQKTPGAPVANTPMATLPTTPLPPKPAGNDSAHNAASDMENILKKNPDVLLQPTQLGSTSLMFSKGDMNILAPFIEAYDNAGAAKPATPEPDDLSSLLESLKSHQATSDKPQAAPLPLPNLYLGSIVYYSPSYWSVWVNGKKLLNTRNVLGGEFYVARISREEVELVWKPSSLLDAPALWRKLTNNGANPLPNVRLDEQQRTITLLMRPNQTFLPKSLAIREGLIKSMNTIGVASVPPPHAAPPPIGNISFGNKATREHP